MYKLYRKRVETKRIKKCPFACYIILENSMKIDVWNICVIVLPQENMLYDSLGTYLFNRRYLFREN